MPDRPLRGCRQLAAVWALPRVLAALKVYTSTGGFAIGNTSGALGSNTEVGKNSRESLR